MDYTYDVRLKELQAFGVSESGFADGSPIAEALAKTKKSIEDAFAKQPTVQAGMRSPGKTGPVSKKGQEARKAD